MGQASSVPQKGVTTVISEKVPQKLQLNDMDCLCQLGRGSFGVVYKAKGPNDSEYAVKIVDPKNNESSRERECLKATEKECPNVIILHDEWTEDFTYLKDSWRTNIHQFLTSANYGRLDTIHVFIFELCEGTLEQYLRKRNDEMFDEGLKNTTQTSKMCEQNGFEQESAAICLQIANGLNYLHSKNMIHRDLKPENILYRHSKVTTGGNTFLIGDFGSSRFMDKTMTFNIGTPLYRAPEVMATSCYTQKADVYSYGLIAIEIIQPSRNNGERGKLLSKVKRLKDDQNDIAAFREIILDKQLLPLFDIFRKLIFNDPNLRSNISTVYNTLSKRYDHFQKQNNVFDGQGVAANDQQSLLNDFISPRTLIRGSFGVVVKAEKNDTTPVALKLFIQSNDFDSREIDIRKKGGHENVVQINKYWKQDLRQVDSHWKKLLGLETVTHLKGITVIEFERLDGE